jgi:hypothetical protein
MSPEQELRNVGSWKFVQEWIEDRPENARTTTWKALGKKLICTGVAIGLNRYFRAGMNEDQFTFSTLDHHRLWHQPRVTVDIRQEDVIRVAFASTTRLEFNAADVQYTLPFEPGFATFRRFLNQLWKETVAEPIPDELCGFSAPVLTPDGV